MPANQLWIEILLAMRLLTRSSGTFPSSGGNVSRHSKVSPLLSTRSLSSRRCTRITPAEPSMAFTAVERSLSEALNAKGTDAFTPRMRINSPPMAAVPFVVCEHAQTRRRYPELGCYSNRRKANRCSFPNSDSAQVVLDSVLFLCTSHGRFGIVDMVQSRTADNPSISHTVDNTTTHANGIEANSNYCQEVRQ